MDHAEFWSRYDAIEARLTAPVSERMLEFAELGPESRVLDLATGRGEPAIRAALRTAPRGRVIGIDSNADSLAIARENARIAGATNLEFRLAAAESGVGFDTASFDVVTSRWGLMYLADPLAALCNARRVLRDDGRLVVALWAEPERVDYATLPRRLLGRYRALPPVDTTLPGAFRYSDRAVIERDFVACGFVVERVDEMAIDVIETATIGELVAWLRPLGLAKLLAELPEPVVREWEGELAAALDPRRVGGMYRLGGVTRIVRARPGPPPSLPLVSS